LVRAFRRTNNLLVKDINISAQRVVCLTTLLEIVSQMQWF